MPKAALNPVGGFDPKELAGEYVPTDLLDQYEWNFELVDVPKLDGFEYHSSSVGPDPMYLFSLEEQKQWLEKESHQFDRQAQRIPDPYWKLMKIDFNWKPREVESIVISFQPDPLSGEEYMTIWEGHHRLAVSLIRGDAPYWMVVGRVRKATKPSSR